MYILYVKSNVSLLYMAELMLISNVNCFRLHRARLPARYWTQKNTNTIYVPAFVEVVRLKLIYSLGKSHLTALHAFQSLKKEQ